MQVISGAELGRGDLHGHQVEARTGGESHLRSEFEIAGQAERLRVSVLGHQLVVGVLIGFRIAERNSTMFSFDGSSLFFLQDAAKANSNTSRYNDVFFIFEAIPQLRCLIFLFSLQDNNVL